MANDIVRLIDRIDLAREVGESHFREFKSALEGPPGKKTQRPWKKVASDIGDTLVGFVNADGGELFVGLEDDGTVSGIPHSAEDIEQLSKAPISKVHEDTPLPLYRSAGIEYQGKALLYFSIPKGTEYVYLTSKGRCLQRKDLETVPVSSEHITFTRSEKLSREYDRQYINSATISDLDLELVSVVAERISIGMSVEKCLQHLDLADYDGKSLRLKRAATLLFAKNPSKWHPRVQVRVLKIAGNELKTGENYNVTSDEQVVANIIELVEKSWELMRPHLSETKFSKDAVFRTKIIYPELACREALINAIAHRDYSSEGAGIEVLVFDNHLEVTSPGGLLSSISLEDIKQLKGVHQSRNSLIARVFKELGYMRELGEGMRRIYELMNQNDLEPPELDTNRTSFRIVLHHKYVYSPEVKIWIDEFSDCDLSRDEKTVVRLGYGGHEISPKEIWGAVGIVDTDYYRQLLESLKKKGILYRSTPKDKAYRLAKARRTNKKNIPQFSIMKVEHTEDGKVTLENIDTSDYAKIFVGNIPYDATEQDLKDIFRKLGSIENIHIPTSQATGRSKGFAFVEFEKTNDAKKALQLQKRLMLNGRTLYIQEFQGKKIMH